jgi:hypothetical protein
MDMPDRRARVLALTQFALGATLLYAVWGLLPSRWMPIDLAGTLLALAQIAAAVGIWTRRAYGKKVALVTAWVTMVCGALLCSALLFTLSHLAGLYGPVGAGGAVLMGVIAALVLPYLVLLPALQLTWLRAL